MKTKNEFKNRLCGQFKQLLAVQVAVLLLCLATASSTAQTYTILHSFGTNVMGEYPHSTLVQGSDGALYGTTEQGGSANRGQVFKVNPDGSGYTVLKDFTGPDGASPEAGLVLSGTTLYGTTGSGGANDNGTVFKVNTDGSGFVVLKRFDGYDGANPYAKLVLSGTELYGTTANGGAFWNGTVFKLNTDGTDFAVLKHFIGSSDGAYPYSSLALSGTTLYGTANGGGSYGNGVVFKVNTDGNGFTVIKSFNGSSEGGGPVAGLVLSGTTLYGTATWGGNSGNGTVFKLNTDGSGFAVLKDFTYSIDGAYPNAGLALSGTTLYGTTPNGGSDYYDYGTVFKINTDGGGFTVLKNFTNWTDGAYCYAGLLLSGATLYGTAYNGGNTGFGTVFKVETDGTGYSVLTNFISSDALNPYGSLLLSGTTFYGTTANGGTYGNGTVFKVNVDGGGYAILKNFTGSDGANPNAGLVLSGGTLYGTAAGGGISGNGTVFKVNTDGSSFGVIKDFTNSIDGANPYAGMVLSSATLYGTAYAGGSNGCGTVFKVSTDGTGYLVLKHFDDSIDAANPRGRLALNDTTLYGTTVHGGSNGYGAVFKVNTDGTGYTVLKSYYRGHEILYTAA